MTCPACGGARFLLQRNDTHGLRIERCDACSADSLDDEQAAKIAHSLAMEAFRAGLRAALSPDGCKVRVRRPPAVGYLFTWNRSDIAVVSQIARCAADALFADRSAVQPPDEGGAWLVSVYGGDLPEEFCARIVVDRPGECLVVPGGGPGGAEAVYREHDSAHELIFHFKPRSKETP